MCRSRSLPEIGESSFGHFSSQLLTIFLGICTELRKVRHLASCRGKGEYENERASVGRKCARVLHLIGISDRRSALSSAANPTRPSAQHSPKFQSFRKLGPAAVHSETAESAAAHVDKRSYQPPSRGSLVDAANNERLSQRKDCDPPAPNFVMHSPSM